MMASVFEWRTLPYGEGQVLSVHSAKRLVALAKTSQFAGSNGNGVLEDLGYAVRAKGIVGVLAAPGCTLEILPKIDVHRPEGVDDEKGEVRKHLVHMLAVALDLKIEVGQIAPLDWQRHTLLEILIRIFCDKLTDAVRRGMPRQYTMHVSDVTILRGVLDISRQFTKHIANPGLLACRYDELSEDIAINQIIKATIAQLSRVSVNALNIQRLRELSFIYSDVEEVRILSLRWEDVVIDRSNQRWQEILEMAKLILGKKFQSTSGGLGQGTALLFDMSTLFEEYMSRLISRAFSGSDSKVTLQGGRKPCLTSLDRSVEVFETKPDIIISKSGKIQHVIDTKWKEICRQDHDNKRGVSQADVYQMMAYAHIYNAPRLTLLYPHNSQLGAEDGIQAKFLIYGQETRIEIASFDIASKESQYNRIEELISGEV